ncbi:unnamed protein product [Brassica oleracea var. botrytis]|uniref:Phytocyanin domain-containing protein n=2 Tax=Brassica TaxID=3705 RepID=A0A0D3DVR7_BRAOL|nr:PREDICTED: early nodulin-like protein 3 [Brassica oleracea var. oleracea]XP_013710682.1 early nodulin-like protein 3 [Brassica napus]KAH0865750.1 hypothetical protein HID58_082961 [Brassica napus]CAF2114059.1 unnamed protein product [Brassica napus]CDY70073.1 BnaUnng03630D [Brassica napus]
MASLIPILSLVFLLFAAFYHLGEARNFTVGGSVPGWKVPDPANNTLKNWAEGRRFIVGDTLVFHYDNKTNDSVLEVTEENYKNCITEKPVNEYKGEPAMVTLSVSGPHYFISGAPGNCQKDEKLIVAVQSTQHPPIPKPNAPTVPTPSKSPTTVTAPAPAPSTAVGLVAGSGIFWAIVAIIGFAWA